MKNKILVNINVPELDKKYDIYLPLNKKINAIIRLLEKAINQMSEEKISLSKNRMLIDYETGIRIEEELLLKDTSIKNGTKLILLS